MKGLARVITDNWSRTALENHLSGEHYSYGKVGNVISEYFGLFEAMKISGSGITVGVKSTNGAEVTMLLLACFLKEIKVVIIPNDISDANYRMILMRESVRVMFVQSNKDIPVETTFVKMWFQISNPISLLTSDMLTSNGPISDSFLSFISSKNSGNFYVNRTNFIKMISSECRYYGGSTVSIVNPGMSGEFKLMSMNLGLILKFLSVVIKADLNKDERIRSLMIGEIHFHTLIISTLFPLFEGGRVIFTENENADGILSAIKVFRINFLFTHSSILENILKSIMPKWKFLRSLRLGLFFKYKFRNIKNLIVFGGLHKKLVKSLRNSFREVIYSYTSSEFPTLVSYKKYKRLPAKKITVGEPKLDVRIESKYSNMPGEISIRIPETGSQQNTTFGYSYRDHTSVRSFKDRDDEIFLTKDLGFIHNGQLVVLGKLQQMFVNENGLTIRSEYIRSLLKSYHFISEAVVTTDPHKLVAIVEIDDVYFISKTLTLQELEAEKLIEVKKEVNSHLEAYTKLDRIIVFPGKFERKGVRVVDGKYYPSILENNPI